MFSSAFHVVCLEFTFFAISLKFEQNVNDIKYINNKTFIFSIILYYYIIIKNDILFTKNGDWGLGPIPN